MKHRPLWSIVLFAGLTGAAFAQTSQPAGAPSAAATLDAGLEPFVTNGTLLVAQADPSRLDIGAVQSWLDTAAANPQAAGTMAKWLDQTKPMATRWLDDFHKAGGGKIFAVAFMGDPTQLPAVVIVPLASGADAKAISGLLVTGKADGPDHFTLATDPNAGIEAIVLHNAVVYGMTQQVEKMKLAKEVDRPLFAAGLAALDDAPLKVVFSPSIALELIAGTALPEKLPDEAGGGSPMLLLNSLDWAGLGLTPPPKSSARLAIQCRNEAGAQAYVTAITALLNTFASERGTEKAIPHKGELIAALKPAVEGNLVTVNVNQETLDEVVRPAMISYMDAGRDRDQHVSSMNNERMLMLGILQFSGDHHGQFPAKIDDVAPYIGGADSVRILLNNPADPSSHPGYIYIKPAKIPGAGENAMWIVLREAGDSADGMVGVAYADGHAGLIAKTDMDAQLKVQATSVAATQP